MSLFSLTRSPSPLYRPLRPVQEWAWDNPLYRHPLVSIFLTCFFIFIFSIIPDFIFLRLLFLVWSLYYRLIIIVLLLLLLLLPSPSSFPSSASILLLNVRPCSTVGTVSNSLIRIRPRYARTQSPPDAPFPRCTMWQEGRKVSKGSVFESLPLKRMEELSIDVLVSVAYRRRK